MKPVVYVSEPEAIDISQIKERLETAGYEIFLGSTDFSANVPEQCEVLLVRSQTRVTADIITTFPNLRSIIRVGTGLDSIDVDFCKANGISIYSAPGANAHAVAEYVIMMMLIVLRKYHLLQSEDVHNWNRYKFRGSSLTTQSIGIVGYGAIGRLVYEYARGLGCTRFYVYDPYVKSDALPEVMMQGTLENVIRNSGIITVHVPLTNETKYLIGERELNAMQFGTILLNASRGGIVNELSVVRAASEGRIFYVADTVENEPSVRQELVDTENIIVTPHMASLTDSAEAAMLLQAVKNFLNRKPTVHG
jgi:phosphoglycerate dehydrogenase-like enzyme